MKRSLLGCLILLILTNSCAILKKSGSAADEFEGYREDLSGTRVAFPSLEEQVAENAAPIVTSTESLAVNDDLEIALRNFTDYNRGEKYWSGFTVLVYSGVDRDLAFKTRNDLYTHFPEIKTDMQYQQPRYLVKVGKYVNRIEAQAHYHKLKDKFPSARIIQDRFQREEYVNPEPIDNGERQNQVTGN
jgi:hypothetical protein